MADPLVYALGLAVAGAALAGSVLPDTTARFLPETWLWSAAHAPVYVVLTASVAGLLRSEPDGLLVSVVLVSLVGMGAEVAQPLWGRSASFVDYLCNEVGVILGAMMTQWRRRTAIGAATGEEGKG
ncbi:MAG: hypothetical protein WDA11_10940 [Thiohalomonadaceae bacterium]